jgi:hypothetical protein
VFGVESPIIQGSSNPAVLSDTIDAILKDEEGMQTLPERGRLFVEKHHHHVDIARQFVRLWSEK